MPPTDPGGLFRPEALRARADAAYPRVLPPMSAPALRWAALGLALTLLAALVVGLLWTVPRTSRVVVVGLPERAGIVVLSGPTDRRPAPGTPVTATIGGERTELVVRRVVGVRTPQQLAERYRGTRVPSVANATVVLSLAAPRDGSPTPARLDGAFATGRAVTAHVPAYRLVLGSGS
ncbi:hypothetical protein [Patulibacter sp. SYSU D01012]|uniref:hypothetical protein n=1 Tax=Patulibacter sp. SYSU D01012 TaxID=2817381 RepID=UPI001B30DBB8|nr:hypothetical protein [Patulibacter sp. SYSU D01012]